METAELGHQRDEQKGRKTPHSTSIRRSRDTAREQRTPPAATLILQHTYWREGEPAKLCGWSFPPYTVYLSRIVLASYQINFEEFKWNILLCYNNQ